MKKTSNVIDQPVKANEDRLNMKAYAEALTAFIGGRNPRSQSPYKVNVFAMLLPYRIPTQPQQPA